MAVLADGPTPAAIANARGHLLEAFVAQFLATQGYGTPRTEYLNVTSEGIEIDVVATHRVTGHRVICECKAYSTNISAGLLTSFIGKFALAKADDPGLHGLFVGLPRLTAEGQEKATAAVTRIPGFHYIGSTDLLELMQGADLLPPIPSDAGLLSEATVVVTEHGLAMAAAELDPDTRRVRRWVVWGTSHLVPAPIIALVERDLASGFPVAGIGAESAAVPLRATADPTLVEVKGSSSDFEYQLPAAPAFFVGRKAIASALLHAVLTRTSAGSIVINAKSGWGKSSLALRLKRDVEKAGGIALVLDTRTAERGEFVTAAMERLVRAAVDAGVIELPPEAAFSSPQSIIETLKASSWHRPSGALLLVFDQFENVFRSSELTREFRNLALQLRDLRAPITVAFSWKTDLVGWTEGHPYLLRDEIRDASDVRVLEPLGPREVETLLRRLERSLGAKLNRELRQRLREYSQGLPWLFKKFAGHVLAEVQAGASQDELVRQALNAQSLFESDLARLSVSEVAVLRRIAQSAPVLVSDLDEGSVPGEVLDSLLHQRLIVQVGDTLDTYWDTFRDFLISGRVAIEDSYVLRYAPVGPGRLLRTILAAGGDVNVFDIADAMGTSSNVVFNYARELRMFGVLTAEPNRLLVDPAILVAGNREDAIRAQVVKALKRHKMHRLALEMLAQAESVTIGDLATRLPSEFPAVEATPDSWFLYTRAFCQWLEYAGIVTLVRDRLTRADDNSADTLPRLLTGSLPVRVRSTFPGTSPGVALRLLRHLGSPTNYPRPTDRAFADAARDLSLIGAVEIDSAERLVLRTPDLVKGHEVDASILRRLVESQRGMREALAVLAEEPATTPLTLGRSQGALVGAEWSEEMARTVGKNMRAWARACGVATALRPRHGVTDGPSGRAEGLVASST